MKCTASLIAIAMLTVSGAAYAHNTVDSTDSTMMTTHMNHDAWKNMTPEQRDAKRAEMREKYKNATPAEQAKMRANHEARMDDRMKNMTPAERDRYEARRDRFRNATPAERDQWRNEHSMNGSMNGGREIGGNMGYTRPLFDHHDTATTTTNQ